MAEGLQASSDGVSEVQVWLGSKGILYNVGRLEKDQLVSRTFIM